MFVISYVDFSTCLFDIKTGAYQLHVRVYMPNNRHPCRYGCDVFFDELMGSKAIFYLSLCNAETSFCVFLVVCYGFII